MCNMCKTGNPCRMFLKAVKVTVLIQKQSLITKFLSRLWVWILIWSVQIKRESVNKEEGQTKYVKLLFPTCFLLRRLILLSPKMSSCSCPGHISLIKGDSVRYLPSMKLGASHPCPLDEGFLVMRGWLSDAQPVIQKNTREPYFSVPLVSEAFLLLSWCKDF